MDGAKETGNMEKKSKVIVTESAARRAQAQITTLRGAVNR